MNKKLLFFLLIPFVGFSQVQIGQNIYGEALDDKSGYRISLSADGNTVVIGAPYNDGNGTLSGHVRVYRNVNKSWQLIGNDIDGNASLNYFGMSVSVSFDGNIIAVGAPGNSTTGSSSGQVRMYEYNFGVWTQLGNEINGESSLDGSGNSVSLSADGKVVAIGAAHNDGNGQNSGHVRVYENISGTWTQVGTDINGEHAGDAFGHSVSLSSDGSVLAIGATMNYNSKGVRSGHVRVFKNITGSWVQMGSDIDGVSVGEDFGLSVTVSGDGNTLAIGRNSQFPPTYVQIYTNVSGQWIKNNTDIISPYLVSSFGNSISLSHDGKTLAIGSHYNDSQINNPGFVQVYKNISGNWNKVLYDIEGLLNDDAFGSSVSISADGNTLAIGAPRIDIDGTGPGYVQVFDLTKLASNNEFVSQNFEIFPNPTSDILNIILENNLVLEEVTIYNNLGQIVKTATENVIDVSHLAKGLYFVEVTTNQGKASKKVIVK